MPEDLRPQIPLTRDATRAFNIACLELEGLRGRRHHRHARRQAREAGGRVTIISSDKDLMQLVGGGVEMFDAMKNARIDAEGVEAKFGVGPEKVVDVQALAGDSVDNIPGAPGIGIKTAALLINEYGDLDTLLERAEEIKQPKRRQTLIENADQIRLSRQLVTLDDMDLDSDAGRPGGAEPEAEPLMAFLAEMEFRTLTRRVADSWASSAGDHRHRPRRGGGRSVAESGAGVSRHRPDAYEPCAISSLAVLDRRGPCARRCRRRYRDDLAQRDDGELVGMSLSVEPGEACYIPLGHVTGGGGRPLRRGRDALAEGQIGLTRCSPR
jgi:DNA polymerase-1